MEGSTPITPARVRQHADHDISWHLIRMWRSHVRVTALLLRRRLLRRLLLRSLRRRQQRAQLCHLGLARGQRYGLLARGRHLEAVVGDVVQALSLACLTQVHARALHALVARAAKICRAAGMALDTDVANAGAVDDYRVPRDVGVRLVDAEEQVRAVVDGGSLLDTSLAEVVVDAH